MNIRKKGPYILLFALSIALIFILGIQYGKYLQQANKEYELTKKQTVSPTPTVETSLAYRRYENTACSIAFTLPETLTKKKESSQEAQFTSPENGLYLDFSCNPNALAATPAQKDTSSLSLNGSTIPSYAESITQDGKPLKLIVFTVTNPQTKINTRFRIDTKLFTLFSGSFDHLK